MKPLYCTAELRVIERAAAAALAEGELMQRAGRAAAVAALKLLPAAEAVVTAPATATATAPAAVLVLAGPGNNGGDALEVAAHLAKAGAQVVVLHCRPSAGQSAERLAALRRAESSTAVVLDALTIGALPSAHWQLVVDGLFGIGLTRPIGGPLRVLVDAVNRLRCPVLALDVPSGLDADTGAIVGVAGVAGVAICASHTITFIGDKPGLHTNEGRDHAGVVTVADLDLDLHLKLGLDLVPDSDSNLDQRLVAATRLQLNHTGLFGAYLRTRRHSSHKGSYGSVAVIGGACGMRGAPILAARTALHAGAGRVYVLFPEDALAADSGQPELMCRLADGYDLEQATLVIGPGLGNSPTAAGLLHAAIASGSALLIDADALNLLAREPALQTALASRAQHASPAVLTPHPLEAARLLGTDVAGVQADRLTAARTLASRLQSVVVLKGSGTVLAAPDGACVINPTGNPALATAGTGDVLSGLCGSLLAQGCPPWPAALAAVWLHGRAADQLVAAGIGPIGMTAGELIPALRLLINRLAR